MGSTQSADVGWEGSGESPDGGGDGDEKVVQTQEPEMLPCHSSASPLSPQLSSLGTPRLGPSIKVWDPYNVLAPPPPPPPPQHQEIQVYLISHGECLLNLRPDLIAGRCPEAALTPNGKRQARALAVFLRSQGVTFNAVYSSPLDRARATALLLCQELNYSEEEIECSDALVEKSEGHWEGCHRSEIYTPETVRLMERFQPDFSPPSGESLRQVEFRMVEFILSLPHKLLRSPPEHHQTASDDTDVVLQRHLRQQRKKSGKSRLQVVTTTGDQEADDEMSPRQPMARNLSLNLNLNDNARAATAATTYVAVFTHSVAIKCAVTGILGCSAVMSQRMCVDDSSVTVMQHSWKTGWQIKRLNDTAHLRLL